MDSYIFWLGVYLLIGFYTACIGATYSTTDEETRKDFKFWPTALLWWLVFMEGVCDALPTHLNDFWKRHASPKTIL